MPVSTPTGASATPRPRAPEAGVAALADAAVVQALRDWWQRHRAQLPAGPIGVAFSGGADSTALLLGACALWPGQVHALHVHHGLQAAADHFEAHARTQAQQWGVAFTALRVTVQISRGASPEDAARRARYQALAQAAQAHGLAVVLLGHHAQDQVESVLLALTRGAGVAGLAGMPACHRWHGVCFGRPLLGLDGAALRRGLQAHAVSWVEDPTNVDLRYTRNRLRATVLPALAQACPSYATTVARSARHAATAAALLAELAAEDLARLGEPPLLAGLRALSAERALNALRHWLRQRHGCAGTDAQWQEVARQLAAARTRAHQIRLRVGQGYLVRRGDRLDYEPDASPTAPL